MMKNELDCWHNEDIICPYCYHRHEDNTIKSGDTVKIECHYCFRKFFITCQQETTYTTTRIDDEGNEVTEWCDEDVNEEDLL